MASVRQFRWPLGILAVFVFVLLIWLSIGRKTADKPARLPTVPVTAAQVTVQDVPLSITALGAAQAWQSVLIRSQVNGILKQVTFTEGTDVTAGQLLAEIDPAPFQAALTQAQGALARDRSLLENARIDLDRYQKLSAQDSIPQQQLDTQTALVQQYQGTVLIDEGVVATAKINLGYCRIISPVSGRIGLRLADPGNLVSTADTTGIVSINQVVPIAVTFTVPQGDFQRLSNVSDGFSRPLAVEALSQETGTTLGVGELRIADNHVDSATGSVALKARFANTKKQLLPGQFVNINLRLETLNQVTTIPSAAVNQSPNGPFAYVIGADEKVAVRPITVAATQDATTVVKSGLKAGEMVVTDGQMTLKADSSVSMHKQDATKTAAP